MDEKTLAMMNEKLAQIRLQANEAEQQAQVVDSFKEKMNSLQIPETISKIIQKHESVYKAVTSPEEAQQVVNHEAGLLNLVQGAVSTTIEEQDKLISQMWDLTHLELDMLTFLMNHLVDTL